MAEEKKTTVVRIRRQGGRVVQDCDVLTALALKPVYIGRRITQGGWDMREDSIWANPYKLENDSDKEREKVLQLAGNASVSRIYYQYILSRPDLMARLHELKGKRLGCWCSPKRCHGDVLVYLVSQLKEA